MKIEYPYKELKTMKRWGVKGESAPWLTTLILKPLFIVRLLWLNVNFLKISGNGLSWLSLVCGIISGYFFFEGRLLLGAIFFLFFNLLDDIDGKTARIFGQAGPYGGFLDLYVGHLSFFFFVFGLTLGQYRFSGDLTWLILSPIMMFFLSFHMFESTTATLMKGKSARDDVVTDNIDKNTLVGKLEYIQKKLYEYEFEEPLNSGDVNYFLFLILPIICIFYDIMLEAVIVCLVLVFLKGVFWIYYYRRFLMSKSKKVKK